jgi:hypothetical protein
MMSKSKISKDALIIDVNQAPSVFDQPVLEVDLWRTYIVNGEVFLVCANNKTGKIRTSTPIRKSDVIGQEFTTETGRVYKCHGHMAPNSLSFRMSLVLSGIIDDVDSCTGEADDLH